MGVCAFPVALDREALQMMPFRCIPSTRFASKMGFLLAAKNSGFPQQVKRLKAQTVERPRALKAREEDGVCCPTSAYVHLPFCKRRCYYCDFTIHVLGAKETQHTAKTVSDYVQLLCEEIMNTGMIAEEPLQTVFFGGGTPSLIPPHELAVVSKTLEQRFGFADEVEMSMEADPGTFDAAKLLDYTRLGVNRISLGVQSFDDEVLKLCGRSHSASEVWSAIRDVRSACVPSWSLDLISGLPATTLESWRATLETAVSCRPNHISVYDLQLEQGTPFSRWYAADTAPLPTHDASAEMYCMASQMLRDAGYEHYEVSNYARPGHRCRHNMTYWMNQPFYGFGLGATSYVGNRRVPRPKKMRAYAEWVRQMHDSDPSARISFEEEMLETLMLRLRLRDGIKLDAFRSEYGSNAESKLKKSLEDYCARGLVECTDTNGASIEWRGRWTGVENMRLCDPKGFLLSNDVLSTVFSTF